MQQTKSRNVMKRMPVNGKMNGKHDNILSQHHHIFKSTFSFDTYRLDALRRHDLLKSD